jgi:hypothetical protein
VVVRGFTPLEKNIIIEAYASNGCTEFFIKKKVFKSIFRRHKYAICDVTSSKGKI